jgi:hypothetical protein
MLSPPPPPLLPPLSLNWLPFKCSEKTPRIPSVCPPRPNWDPTPHPLSSKRACPAPEPKGGGTPVGEGVGSPNSDDYSVEKPSAPSLPQSKFGRENTCLFAGSRFFGTTSRRSFHRLGERETFMISGRTSMSSRKKSATVFCWMAEWGFFSEKV